MPARQCPQRCDASAVAAEEELAAAEAAAAEAEGSAGSGVNLPRVAALASEAAKAAKAAEQAEAEVRAAQQAEAVARQKLAAAAKSVVPGAIASQPVAGAREEAASMPSQENAKEDEAAETEAEEVEAEGAEVEEAEEGEAGAQDAVDMPIAVGPAPEAHGQGSGPQPDDAPLATTPQPDAGPFLATPAPADSIDLTLDDSPVQADAVRSQRRGSRTIGGGGGGGAPGTVFDLTVDSSNEHEDVQLASNPAPSLSSSSAGAGGSGGRVGSSHVSGSSGTGVAHAISLRRRCSTSDGGSFADNIGSGGGSGRGSSGSGRSGGSSGSKCSIPPPERLFATLPGASEKEAEAFEKLAVFLEANGGDRAALAGWRCRAVARAGTPVQLYYLYYSSEGKQFRSRPDVACFLGLDVTRVVSSRRCDEVCGWVQCENCSKWRRLAANDMEALPEGAWTCAQHPDARFASCDVAAEEMEDGERTSEELAIERAVGGLLRELVRKVAAESSWETRRADRALAALRSWLTVRGADAAVLEGWTATVVRRAVPTGCGDGGGGVAASVSEGGEIASGAVQAAEPSTHAEAASAWAPAARSEVSTREKTALGGWTGPKRVRCRGCGPCLASDCGECSPCLDKPKFGGPGTQKQACVLRRCVSLGPARPPAASMIVASFCSPDGHVFSSRADVAAHLGLACVKAVGGTIGLSWVMCDECKKWRRIDSTAASKARQEEEWYCWEHPEMLDCEMPEEEMEDDEQWSEAEGKGEDEDEDEDEDEVEVEVTAAAETEDDPPSSTAANAAAASAKRARDSSRGGVVISAAPLDVAEGKRRKAEGHERVHETVPAAATSTGLPASSLATWNGMADVQQLLDGLGLPEYVAAFEAAGYDDIDYILGELAEAAEAVGMREEHAQHFVREARSVYTTGRGVH